MKSERWLGLAWAAGVLALLLPGRALASMTFPEAIQTQLGLPDVPPPAPGCRICHRDDNGGLMTTTKPFGRAMIAAGATASSVPKMLAALASVESSGVDSDSDGVGDVAELREGTDPNVRNAQPGETPGETPEPDEPEVPLPETGCSVGSPRTPVQTPARAAGALALLAFWGGRRALTRRRRRR